MTYDELCARLLSPEPLEIDGVVRSRIGSRAPKIQPAREAEAVAIGRLTLEKAALATQLAIHDHIPNLSELKRIETASAKAFAALGELLRCLDPRVHDDTDQDAALIAHVLRQFPLSIPIGNKTALQAAGKALVHARATVGDLKEGAAKRRRAVAARFRPSRPEDLETHAFLNVMAEGWIFLTGAGIPNQPTSGTGSQTPFIAFAAAGWRDWRGGDAPAFTRVVGAVRKGIAAPRAAALAQMGPPWVN